RSTGVGYATPPADTGLPTARCLILVTPDAERTMNTYLGVAGELGPSDIDEALVASAAITYVEGYLVGLPSAEAALARAADTAHRAGRRLALTLSDPLWAQLQHDAFVDLLPTVDILLGNEAEALEVTGERDLDAALARLAKTSAVVAITRGAAGAVATDGTDTVSVEAEPVAELEDTTGAGDLFAAGFLLGQARKRPLTDCLRLGALAAAEVLSHTGARPQKSLAALAAARGL
ncbi:MAG TPA: adenosine kinase, partial [Acidimicrobiia bacterium]|nr:adenosine kinase [Acidimicrobiia bacterium]